MTGKVFAYLALVLGNWWFLLGILGGYVAKVYLGGRMISLATGLIVGILIHEFLKFMSWR